MSKIYLLDDIDLSKEDQYVRCKKKYNITLFNIFPPVLESIIKEYIDDIIEINLRNMGPPRSRAYTSAVSAGVDHSFSVYITDQYINCIPITIYCEIIYGNNYLPIMNYDNNDIISCNIPCIEGYLYAITINTYMKKFYNKNNYFDISILDSIHNNKYNIICNNDTLCCSESYYMYYKHNRNVINIQIKNHKLFKNIIVILKCIINNLQKN